MSFIFYPEMSLQEIMVTITMHRAVKGDSKPITVSVCFVVVTNKLYIEHRRSTRHILSLMNDVNGF